MTCIPPQGFEEKLGIVPGRHIGMQAKKADQEGRAAPEPTHEEPADPDALPSPHEYSCLRGNRASGL